MSSPSTTLDENFLSQLLPLSEMSAIRNWVSFLQQQEIRTLADVSMMSENDWSTGCGNIPLGVRNRIRYEAAQSTTSNNNNTINSGVPSSSSSSSSATTTGTTSATLPTMMNNSNNNLTDAYVRQQQQYHYQPQLYSFQAPPPPAAAVPAYNNNDNNINTSSFPPLPQYPPPASENNNQQEKYYHFEAPPPASYQPSAYQPSNMMMMAQEQEKNNRQNEYLKQRRQDQQQERQEQRGGHPQYHPSHHHHHHHHQQHHQQDSVTTTTTTTTTTSGTRASRATGTRSFKFEIRDPVLAEEFFTKSFVPKLVNPPRDRDIYDRFVRHWGGFDPWDRQNNHCGRCHHFASKLEGNGEHMESHHPSDRCPYYNERGEEMKKRWAANSKEFIRSAEDFLHRYRQKQQQHHQQAEPIYYKGFLIKFPFHDPVLVEKFFLQENLPHTEEEQQLTQDIKDRLVAHWNGFNPWLQHQCARCWKYTSKISGNGRFYAADHTTRQCPWWDEEGNATSRSRELVQYYHNHHLFREAAREYLEKHQPPPQQQQHQEQQHGGGRGDSEDYSTLFENPNHDGQRGSQEFNRDLYSQRRQRE